MNMLNKMWLCRYDPSHMHQHKNGSEFGEKKKRRFAYLCMILTK